MSGARPARRGERGSAVVELIAVGLVMLLPLVHLVVVVSRVQAGAFAVEAAARAAARAAASATDPAAGGALAQASVVLALRDQGFDVTPGEAAAAVSVQCGGVPCATPGALVSVTVEYEVQLPGVPAFLDAALPAAVPVRGSSAAVVDEFAAAPAALAPSP